MFTVSGFVECKLYGFPWNHNYCDGSQSGEAMAAKEAAVGGNVEFACACAQLILHQFALNVHKNIVGPHDAT